MLETHITISKKIGQYCGFFTEKFFDRKRSFYLQSVFFTHRVFVYASTDRMKWNNLEMLLGWLLKYFVTKVFV